jgi:hypothetical protein
LGTGTSSSIPHVDCLTYDPAIHRPCKTCLSTLEPGGKKNVRRNTGAVVRMKVRDGRSVWVNFSSWAPHLTRGAMLLIMVVVDRFKTANSAMVIIGLLLSTQARHFKLRQSSGSQSMV